MPTAPTAAQDKDEMIADYERRKKGLVEQQEVRSFVEGLVFRCLVLRVGKF